MKLVTFNGGSVGYVDGDQVVPPACQPQGPIESGVEEIAE